MISYKKFSDNKKYKKQFIPNKYFYLTKTTYVEYKDKQLKTAYLINIIHEMTSRYFFHKNDLIENEVKFPLSSTILKSKYGMDYNYYIDYLVEKEFMFLFCNYYAGKKARVYKLKVNSLLDIRACRITDKVVLKKNSKEYLKKTYLTLNSSPIPLELRTKLVEFLYYIEIDSEKALVHITEQKENKILEHNKYWKNKLSIDSISEGDIFFKFDKYGRFHTNFTVLKKEIRQKYITINGDDICEIDLDNSQPFFLAQLMKQEMSTKQLIATDVTQYIGLVKNGIIYEEIMSKCDIKTRDDAKKMMYKVMFGKNGEHSDLNLLFYNLFPTVYKFITKYKTDHGCYKELSYKLQNIESDFIFNKVIPHILKKEPDIILFTIHDSICYPLKYRSIVNDIFDYYKRQIL